MDTKTVFITGASGHMGLEAVKLLAENDNIRLRLLILAAPLERRKLGCYRNYSNIEIIEGDLRNIEDVRRGVKGADYVLHLGALIPPAAERFPDLTEKINLGGTLNVIRAIKEQEEPDKIRLVFIATVALMGNRPAPVHWCRTGDPIKVSLFDSYGVSKVKAERAVIESGLKYWVSLRQSGMLHKDMLKIMDPIIFHQPLNNYIEWSTAEDSGRALYNICTKNLPQKFWRNIYNIGSGSEFRETYHDFCKTLFGRMGIRDIHKLLNPRDFALQNFHCVWYSDSDRLNKWLNFRKSTYEGFLKTLDIPFYYRLVKLIPVRLLRKMVIEPLSRKTEGPRNWLENNIIEKIRAYWGSREKWEHIPDKWEDFRIERVPEARFIDHGWDETRSIEKVDLNDCRSAAGFRGGECLSAEMPAGDIFTQLKWRCALGHEFEASPNAVLRGGHWCPVCDTDVSRYEAQAASNRFFGQVY